MDDSLKGFLVSLDCGAMKDTLRYVPLIKTSSGAEMDAPRCQRDHTSLMQQQLAYLAFLDWMSTYGGIFEQACSII